MFKQELFHGGCHGCTQQKLHSIKFCMGCQYFDADWSLPNLSNRPLSSAELLRNRLKKVSGASNKLKEYKVYQLPIKED